MVIKFCHRYKATKGAPRNLKLVEG